MYCARKVKERANELETLKELTSWNTIQYKDYVTEFYNKLDDPSLIYKVKVDEKEEYAPPIFPGDKNDPNKGLKLFILAGVMALMVMMFFLTRRKSAALTQTA